MDIENDEMPVRADLRWCFSHCADLVSMGGISFGTEKIMGVIFGTFVSGGCYSIHSRSCLRTRRMMTRQEWDMIEEKLSGKPIRTDEGVERAAPVVDAEFVVCEDCPLYAEQLVRECNRNDEGRADHQLDRQDLP